ncbi:hypothetical protein [Millionella massiliensis]|uniref:hypothetical protein n=1 Tax=Millionella massiliensis TaxID=1871023 RepID=UPI0023A8059D|nr:hypothetical protein [Millionella massiliensis]
MQLIQNNKLLPVIENQLHRLKNTIIRFHMSCIHNLFYGYLPIQYIDDIRNGFTKKKVGLDKSFLIKTLPYPLETPTMDDIARADPEPEGQVRTERKRTTVK